MQNWSTYLKIEECYHGERDNIYVILFVFLYMQLNTCCNDKFGSNTGDRKKMVECLSNESKIIDRYNAEKDDIMRNFNNEREFIKNCKNNRKIYYNTGHNTLKDFLNIIYNIRCNMFHGEKEPTIDNIKLIAWAYQSLNKVVGEWLESYSM